MSWIAKIVSGTPDEFVHAKLMKYGIGSHPGPRARISLSKPTIKFKADIDQEKMFIKGYTLNAPEGTHKVKGMIITYSDRTNEFGKLTMPISWSKSKGKGAPVFKAKIDESAPLKDIKALIEVDDPTTFYLFSLNPKGGAKPWKIATKTSFPKGGPAEEDEETEGKDPVFSKGALANTPETLEFILDNYLPDLKNKISSKTKDIWIRNNFEITDIVIPTDSNLSFSEKRRLAKKRGKLIRNVSIDGEDFTTEFDFFA
ncbi:MAG: hypothetical protein JW779_13395 [Candidatus Thorarchaeota archaeon]|nr:hypothetical protein [Candidatus Thorarchaeota archaeon]